MLHHPSPRSRTVAITVGLLLGLSACCVAQQPQRWTLVRELRIGDLDRPDYALSRVSDLAVGPAGEIYVGQPVERAVRQYDARGVFVQTLGRPGSGPGEFSDLERLGWRGDSLWAADFKQQRITFFGRDGRAAGSVRATSPVVAGAGHPAPPAAALSDGSLVGQPGPSSQSIRDGTATVLPLLRMDRRGTLAGDFGALDVRGDFQVVRHGRRIMQWTLPLQSHSLWDAAPDGSSLVVVHRPLPSSGAPAEFRVARYRASGARVFERGYRYSPRAVTPADRDSIHDLLAGIFQEIRLVQTEGEAQQIARESFPVPQFQPPVTEVAGGRDGTIWLRRERMGRERGEYTVLDSAGAVLASVAAPPGLRILQAQRDRVWGVELDDWDVPYVVRYRVVAAR